MSVLPPGLEVCLRGIEVLAAAVAPLSAGLAEVRSVVKAELPDGFDC